MSTTTLLSSRRGILRCSAAAVLFGVSAPAASRLTGDMGPFTLAGLLYLGAAIAVLPVLRRTRFDRLALRRGAGRLITAVVIGGAVGPVLLATGLSHAPAATASLLLNLELVFTTVLAFFIFKEHIGSRVAAGTVVVFSAGLILTWSGDADLRWGSVLIAAACLCWAVDNCVTAALDELAPSHITFAKGLIAGTANVVLGLVLDGVPNAGPLIAALVVGGFGYGASITLWVAGARDLGAARAQLVFATARSSARSWRGRRSVKRSRGEKSLPWLSPRSASDSSYAALMNTITDTSHCGMTMNTLTTTVITTIRTTVYPSQSSISTATTTTNSCTPTRTYPTFITSMRTRSHSVAGRTVPTTESGRQQIRELVGYGHWLRGRHVGSASVADRKPARHRSRTGDDKSDDLPDGLVTVPSA